MAELSNSQKKRENRTYERAGIVAISDVLPLIADKSIKKVELHGHVVNVTSLRLRNFVKSTTCATCGLQATHFAVENNSGYSWHLNLWADRGPDKKEMLFTHDHTIARSLGGADDETNTTTMCAKCNHTKGKQEHVDFCILKGLPLPGTKQKRRIEKSQSVAATAALRREQNKLVHVIPMEYAVRKFRKLQIQAVNAS